MSAAARGKRGRDASSADAASVASSLPAAPSVGTRVVVGGAAYCEIAVDFWSARQRADSRKFTGKPLPQVRAVLAVPSAATPRDLLLAVLQAWQWDEDHLFALEIGGRRVEGSLFEEECMLLRDDDDDGGPDKYDKWPPLASLVDGGLAVGQRAKIVYDFGDNWQWAAEVKKVHAGGAPADVEVISVMGEAPKQYYFGEEVVGGFEVGARRN